MATPRQVSEPYPWTDLDVTWYAALVDGGEPYGLVRRVPSGDYVTYETWNRQTLAWQPTREGLGYFSGIGGVTDAVASDEAEAMRVLTELGSTPDA